MTNFIAHVRKDAKENWHFHALQEHLKKVAELAARFAGRHGSLFAEYAGLLHDLGKFQQAFQEYIGKASGFEKVNAHLEDVESGRPNKIPHSTAGAKYAVNQIDPLLGHLLAYLIAGHHAGLADWHDKGSLKDRLQKADDELASALAGVQQAQLSTDFFKINENGLSEQWNTLCANNENFAEELHIWIRFLFSCLVDADFLDTEAFMCGFANADEAKKAGVRPDFPSLQELNQRYENHMQDLATKADKNTPLNQERQIILKQCLDAAELDKSLFSLTVPTGGGKTLASLGFALKHALKFNKKRIIYTIPFTSIIEQNATVFRNVLGTDVVLEHHSNLEVSEDKETAKNRLAAENWDAPLIVTTNVQFFESLFAARTSRCRKIHNIADSVVILDESQQIPRDFQKPITDMMRVLAKDYGVTFVLCTATQPELGKEVDAFGRIDMVGLNDVYEIIHNKTELAKKLQRVQVYLPNADTSKQTWQQVADEIAQHACVLAVVNTRRHARLLFEALPSDGIKLHLSANMCAAHRAEVIALIRRYLYEYHQGRLKRPLWVVSTQLIEAGVDVDFPVVYRAMAGLDSIIQTAGRCNREGKLPDLGKVVVFRAEQGAPSGSLKQGQDITEEMLAAGGLNDPLLPETFSEYFRRFRAKGEVDKYKVTHDLTMESSQENPLAIKFRTAAEKFRLIDNKGVALVVPFIPLVWQQEESPKIVQSTQLEDFFEQHLADVAIDDWQKTLKDLRYPNPQNQNNFQPERSSLPEPFETWFAYLQSDPLKHKWVYRKLQRYTITVYEHELAKLPKGVVFERAGLLVLDTGYYCQLFGIDADDLVLPPEQSVL